MFHSVAEKQEHILNVHNIKVNGHKYMAEAEMSLNNRLGHCWYKSSFRLLNFSMAKLCSLVEGSILFRYYLLVLCLIPLLPPPQNAWVFGIKRRSLISALDVEIRNVRFLV